MPRSRSEHPTDAELPLLQLVWQLGQPTIQEIYEARRQDHDVSLASVATTVRGMIKKRILRYVTDGRPLRVEAAVDQTQTHRTLIRQLANRLAGGSVPALVVLILQGLKFRPELRHELERIARDMHEDEQGK